MNDDTPEMLFHYLYQFLLAFMGKKKVKESGYENTGRGGKW